MKEVLKNNTLLERGQLPLHTRNGELVVARQNLLNKLEDETSLTATDRNIENMTHEQRIQSVDESLARARNMRKKRKLTNADPTWNKRIRVTHARMNKKRKPTRRYNTRKRRRYNSRNCSIVNNSERS